MGHPRGPRRRAHRRDRVKALTEYLTPLDGFTQGRDAVLAAAAATGTRVIWLDSTTGVSHVVTRARPAARCEAAPRSAAAAMP